MIVIENTENSEQDFNAVGIWVSFQGKGLTYTFTISPGYWNFRKFHQIDYISGRKLLIDDSMLHNAVCRKFWNYKG